MILLTYDLGNNTSLYCNLFETVDEDISLKV